MYRIIFFIFFFIFNSITNTYFYFIPPSILLSTDVKFRVLFISADPFRQI
jgi:hypothetical protein